MVILYENVKPVTIHLHAAWSFPSFFEGCEIIAYCTKLWIECSCSMGKLKVWNLHWKGVDSCSQLVSNWAYCNLNSKRTLGEFCFLSLTLSFLIWFQNLKHTASRGSDFPSPKGKLDLCSSLRVMGPLSWSMLWMCLYVYDGYQTMSLWTCYILAFCSKAFIMCFTGGS